MPTSPESDAGGVDRRPNAVDRRPVRFDVPCVNCGYNLRGLVERRCPECGRPFTVSRARIAARGAVDHGFWAIYRRALLTPRRFWTFDGQTLRDRTPIAFALGCALLSAAIWSTLVILMLRDSENWGPSAMVAMWSIYVIVGVMASVPALFAAAWALALFAGLIGKSWLRAGWRAVAAAAVWLPAWSILAAILYAESYRSVQTMGIATGTVSQPVKNGMLVALILLTICYAGLAVFLERPREPRRRLRQ